MTKSGSVPTMTSNIMRRAGGTVYDALDDYCRLLVREGKIADPKDKPACDKIHYLPVAPMFAEAINRIYEEMSISSLFE